MELPKRKPNRLKEYDYSRNGAYFITICTQNRLYLLSEIPVGDGFPVPKLTHAGNIVLEHVNLIIEKYPSMHIDKHVIMPNHIHMILTVIGDGNGTGNPSPTIGTAMGWFKYQTTKIINDGEGSIHNRIWQRSYHDHIIRNEREYEKIWQYIDTNPLKWEDDCFYGCENNNSNN